jgi:hypothetical protein
VRRPQNRNARDVRWKIISDASFLSLLPKSRKRERACGASLRQFAPYRPAPGGRSVRAAIRGMEAGRSHEFRKFGCRMILCAELGCRSVTRLAASREFWGCFIFLTSAQRQRARVEHTAVRQDIFGNELVLTGRNDLGIYSAVMVESVASKLASFGTRRVDTRKFDGTRLARWKGVPPPVAESSRSRT